MIVACDCMTNGFYFNYCTVLVPPSSLYTKTHLDWCDTSAYSCHIALSQTIFAMYYKILVTWITFDFIHSIAYSHNTTILRHTLYCPTIASPRYGDTFLHYIPEFHWNHLIKCSARKSSTTMVSDIVKYCALNFSHKMPEVSHALHCIWTHPPPILHTIGT